MINVVYTGNKKQYTGLHFNLEMNRWVAFTSDPWSVKSRDSQLMLGGYEGILLRAPTFGISLI